MKRIFMTVMLSLMAVMGIIIWSISADARTAHVTYAYNGKGDVAILVSETPNFTEALKDGQTIHGQKDVKHLGYVDIGGLVPGKTYYFSAVAFDGGDRSPFSATLSKLIPPYKGFVVTSYPALPLDGKQVEITIKLK